MPEAVVIDEWLYIFYSSKPIVNRLRLLRVRPACDGVKG